MSDHSPHIVFLLGWTKWTINPETHPLYHTNTTLLQFLRSLPDHKGTKEGCGEGDCGACTVLIGETGTDQKMIYKTVNACLVLLPMIHGRQIITIEHISNGDELHPVQQSFIVNHASQCGFCTPGFVMSTLGLYHSSDATDDRTINDHLAGNLCRCTGYVPVLKAARESCQHIKPDLISLRQEEAHRLLKDVGTSTLAISKKENQWYQPTSLEELLRLKSKYKQAYLLSGATDLALKVTKQFQKLECVIDMSRVHALKTFLQNDDHIIAGSTLSLNELRDKLPPSLKFISDLIDVFGSYQIRNLATIGGNLASASPIGDLLPALCVLDAEICLRSKENVRMVKLTDFLVSYRKTDIKDDEVLEKINIPIPRAKDIIRSYKISKRRDLDISTVSATFQMQVSNERITAFRAFFGGMAATVIEAEQTARYLINKRQDRETRDRAWEILYNEFDPIDDARANAEGRRLFAANLLLTFFNETLDL